MSFSRLSRRVPPVREAAISERLGSNRDADDVSLTFGVGPKEVDGKRVDGFGYYETIG